MEYTTKYMRVSNRYMYTHLFRQRSINFMSDMNDFQVIYPKRDTSWNA